MRRVMGMGLFVTALMLVGALFAGCDGTSRNEVSTSAPSSPASVQVAEVVPADGDYDVLVTLEGGSGRASVESPARLVVEDGAMTATITWSSSNYDLMVVDGAEYRPVNDGGNSTFQIPVAELDRDLAVQAETTAMSEAHLIDYMLRFSLDADADGQIADGEAIEATAAQIGELPSADLGNGWQPESSLDLRYATEFAVDYFEGGYKLVRLASGERFLTVPESASVPDGLADDIVVLQQPLGDVYLVASDAMCLFDALGALDAITVSGIAQDSWHIPSAVAAMESGAITYGGKYSAPDYDMLLASGVRLAIESTMINHTPAVREKLIELGIPVFTELSSYEASPLGRTEWVKLYGALLDEEELAASLFEQQVATVKQVEGADTGKTVAFFYINSNGAAVVRRPGDYVTAMIDLAGGHYVFDDLDEATNASTVTLEMERFYAQAKDADIVVYNATIDDGVDSLDALVAKNQLLENFKAVQEGAVWVAEPGMYQHMMSTGDIVSDFHRAFLGEDADLTYLHRL